MRVGCAASAQSGLLVCYMTLASNEAAAPRRALEAATGGTKLTHRRTDSSPIPQIRSPPTRKELVLLINFGLAGARKQILRLRSLLSRGRARPRREPILEKRAAAYRSIVFLCKLGDNGVVWKILEFWQATR